MDGINIAPLPRACGGRVLVNDRNLATDALLRGEIEPSPEAQQLIEQPRIASAKVPPVRSAGGDEAFPPELRAPKDELKYKANSTTRIFIKNCRRLRGISFTIVQLQQRRPWNLRSRSGKRPNYSHRNKRSGGVSCFGPCGIRVLGCNVDGFRDYGNSDVERRECRRQRPDSYKS